MVSKKESGNQLNDQRQPFFCQKEIKQKINCESPHKTNPQDFFENLSPPEKIAFFRNVAITRFGSINKFSQALGVSRSMGCQILGGTYIPLKSSSIEKIADVLGINVVILTKTFEEIKNDTQ